MQASWMVLASFFFACMSVCIKFASAYFGTMEIVFWRGAIGVLFLAVLCWRQRVTLYTAVPMMHLWRTIVGVLSLTAWFYAIGRLPLATAMTLNYMSGVWVAAFLVGATLLMGSLHDARRQGPLVMTVVAAFVGVVMLLRPAIEQNQLFAGLVGLLSGLGSALAYLQVAALGRVGEPEARTVFYFSCGATLAGALGMGVQGSSWLARPEALWLLPIGIFAALGQLSMTKAYTRGATLVVANLQYSGIVFSALFGLALFGDEIALIGWAGMVLIVVSGIAATFLRARAMPLRQAPPPDEDCKEPVT